MLPEFHFIGGHEALDFSNTVAWPPQGASNDRLVSYDRLLEWGRRTSLISAAESRRLAQRARRTPRLATAALRRAVDFRSALHRILAAVTRDKPVARADVKALNNALRKTGISLGAPTARRFSLSVSAGEPLDIVTERVLWSAAQLLTSDDLSRVGMCHNEKCGWVFMDSSRNQSRRWCAMAECGSRAKSRTYYRRNKRKRATVGRRRRA